MKAAINAAGSWGFGVLGSLGEWVKGYRQADGQAGRQADGL